MDRDPRRRKTAGFSLVESMLAIGVLAFASVGLLGLLSTGLENFRGAIDRSTGTQISQRIAGDVAQMDFDALLAMGNGTGGDFFMMPERSFDEQGNEVLPADPARPTQEEANLILYRTRVRVARPGAEKIGSQSLSGFTSLPSPDTMPRFQLRDTVFLTIQVANNPGNVDLPADGQQLWPVAMQKDRSVMTTSAIVTRSDRQHK